MSSSLKSAPLNCGAEPSGATSQLPPAGALMGGLISSGAVERNSGLLRHELRGALRHLVGRDVLHVRRYAPAVAERVLKLAGAVAVELIGHRPHALGAGAERACEHVVHLLDVQAERDRRAADLLRA